MKGGQKDGKKQDTEKYIRKKAKTNLTKVKLR